jgi:hypothetical protein
VALDDAARSAEMDVGPVALDFFGNCCGREGGTTPGSEGRGLAPHSRVVQVVAAEISGLLLGGRRCGGLPICLIKGEFLGFFSS